MGIRARPVTLPVTGTRTRSAHPEPAFSLQAVSEARRQPTDQRRLNPPLDASQARRAKIHLRAAVGSYQTKRGNLPTWSPGANRCRDAGTRISAVCASGRPLAPGRCLAGCPARPRVDLDHWPEVRIRREGGTVAGEGAQAGIERSVCETKKMHRHECAWRGVRDLRVWRCLCAWQYGAAS